MKRVNVLLSSYNGEAFIEEQLQSVAAQEGVTTNIIVRDDGSTDGTRDILDRWQESGKLTWYGGDNIGWSDSFMHLLVHAPEADYYAFCDQDDIWMPDKLKVAVEHLERHPDTPTLYCSNLLRYRDGNSGREAHRNVPRLFVLPVHRVGAKAARHDVQFDSRRALGG